ncbi:MAG: hypothetical protein N0E58_15765 [Candidatus Thiodiazotropha endolucinida]|uniref:Integrase catalytic domain-containing protein n=1 Tax=Candidatus Thiodiazotropha taylori TaxID=2792791 RepID=A0A9E4TVB0_9GAMM|nr:hypothetical protein [Candidatus Thiodiazotropha taylori]MCW4237704.1 hypothetical protein [Candidatus Thiodiazotropha endolucinida]
MLIDYKERLRREPHLRDMQHWPAIPADSIPQEKRSGYRLNLRVVQMALSGQKYRKIQQATGMHPSQITRLLKRCLTGPEDVPPPLTQALIPSQQIKPISRNKPLSCINAPTGAKGAFQHLLDVVPALRENLDQVLKESLRKGRHGENITPRAFHQYLLLFLEQAGHPEDLYPYTEDSLGYESGRLYLHHRLGALQSERIARQQPKRILAPTERPFEIGREIQIDEQTYDAESSVYLELSGKVTAIRIGRFAVVIVSDADSTCALSYRLAFTQHCSQYDVLSAMELAMQPTETTNMSTPGINVPLGPCFPNQLGEDYARIAFNTVALDNALAHCAASVEGYVCNQHQGTVSLGIPAAPKARHVIETAFRLLSHHAKRHKSTSGAYPTDPLRESTRQKKRPPVVTVSQLEEAIYAVLAMHNRTPKAHLMGSSPLDIYQQMMREHPLRLLPDPGISRHSPFEMSQEARVRWLKHEGRTPHINFYGTRYKGPGLSGLENQIVTLIFDYRDIRELQVVSADGQYRGRVLAPKSWQHFSHGIKTRQYINKLCRVNRIRMKDPLVEYFWLQLQRKNSKKGSLEMLRLYREFNGLARPKIRSEENTVNTEEEIVDHLEDKRTEDNIPPWTPDIANAFKSRQDETGDA